MRGRRKTKASKPIIAKVIDATPERLAKGDASEMVNPAKIDSSEQPIGLTRRFRSSHLDRLYANDRLTWAQWHAGDWYRNQHARCRFALSVVASYGEQTSAGEINYGLPRSEAQLRARQLFHKARMAVPGDMRGFIDRLLLHDEMPRYGGKAAMRNLRQIGSALDALAAWLNTPLTPGENSSTILINVA